MSAITDIIARQILDSRGNPTIEVDVYLESGAFGRAAVPSGASTGSYEAVELRDGDKSLYGGLGVLGAVDSVNNEIFEAISGMDAYDQRVIDQSMIDLDGTEQKSRLGANSILGVSLAVAKAAADDLGVPFYRYLGGMNATVMPRPMMNVINGGAHADNGLSIQEFMIVPIIDGSFSDKLRMGSEIFHSLKKVLCEKGLVTAVGDEGGFAPKLVGGADSAFDLMLIACSKAGYKAGEDVAFALDVAANEIFVNGLYTVDGKSYDRGEMVDYYDSLCSRYPIISIEDPMSEDDFEGWKAMTTRLGEKIQIVGDDIFVTQKNRLLKGIDSGLANAILIKPNQVGTLTETIETIRIAHAGGFKTVMSHRSGETEDVTIADLAVGLGVAQIKTGSLCRSDRIAKYNQLLRIESDII
jgi:enolase